MTKSHSRVVIREEHNRDYALKLILGIIPDRKAPMVIEIKPFVKKRTLAQNALQHKWYTEIAEQTGNDMDTVKSFLKMKFLGYEVTEMRMKDGSTKMVSYLRSTASLNTKESAAYMLNIEVWADEYGIVLSKPEELYWSIAGDAIDE